MAKKELVQGSKEWHAWRRKGLGGSDAPTVMGESPWSTPFMLWAVKTGKLEPAPFSPWTQKAVDKGHRLEPLARAKYIEKTGIVTHPNTAVHPDYDFIRVSTDGYNAELGHIIEIKCPGIKTCKEAAAGIVSTTYYWQLMHQYMVLDAKTMDYVVYDEDNDKLHIIPVPRNREDEARLLEALKEFWYCVENEVPPKVDMADLDGVVQRIKELQDSLTKATSALVLLNDCLLKGSTSDF
jgi:putative phage-type endonuclease